MNLATARSVKRAKEIGVQKSGWRNTLVVDQTIYWRSNVAYIYFSYHCVVFTALVIAALIVLPVKQISLPFSHLFSG